MPLLASLRKQRTVVTLVVSKRGRGIPVSCGCNRPWAHAISWTIPDFTPPAWRVRLPGTFLGFVGMEVKLHYVDSWKQLALSGGALTKP